jgi:4-hydroxy-3-methylbut-2-enyl diphosphate reductase
MPPSDQTTYFRKGFGLKAEVETTLDADYSGRLVDLLRERDYTLEADGVTVRLAQEFGFCYGVERAVEYAYQTRRKFPERRIFLAGEIIHNPHVNAKLREMVIEVLGPRDKGFDYDRVEPADVVILPAFGVTIHDFQTLREKGCVVVDTTCGSVLNVWKRVESYARDGFTCLIHGKHYHEETRATASQVHKFGERHYIVVRDMAEARVVCDYIEGRGSRDELLARFADAVSPGFDPDLHLKRVGVANQTTMLARESLAIGEEVGRAMERAHGAA